MCGTNYEGANCQYEKETISLTQGVSNGEPVDWGLIFFWNCLICVTIVLLVLAKLFLDKTKKLLESMRTVVEKDRNED